MEPFRISVADDVLDDLRARLVRSRFTTSSASGWDAGTDPAYLRSLVEYWAHGFDWRAAEARLNAYPQFLHRGQHFVHVRRDSSRPPVLLAHGWPSSFLEMLPLVDLLDVDVVVPSLPGFLFSDLVEGPLTRAAIAESFHTTMTEALGYERYFAFGGDIGGAASPHPVLGDRMHRHLVPSVPGLATEREAADHHGAGRGDADLRVAVRAVPTIHRRACGERRAPVLRARSRRSLPRVRGAAADRRRARRVHAVGRVVGSVALRRSNRARAASCASRSRRRTVSIVS